MRELIVILMLVATSSALEAQPSQVLETLKTEITRSMEQLKKQPTPPYFLSYEITESETAGAAGSFGALVTSSTRISKSRMLSIDLRVGDYQLDNTHPIRGTSPIPTDNLSFYQVPIEDDPDALRSLLWYYTDQRYKRAVEQLISVKTNVKVKAGETDKSGDFSPTPPEKFIEPPPPSFSAADIKVMEDKVRMYSLPFKRFGNIYSVRVNHSFSRRSRWFVSSDGASIQTSEPVYQLSISAFSKAADGMELPRYQSFYSSTLAGLPSDQVVLAAVDKMAKELMALKLAPPADAYAGPAILSPRSTAVLFHEIFGHRIEGQREKREEQSQTYRDKIGQKVLPEFLSVYGDPTAKSFAGVELAGYYKFDNEGVKARRVPLVENGILKNFLMSRLPVDGFPVSNGHGRRYPGYNVAGRQSNLIVTASKTVSPEELKKLLIEEVKKANLQYGLYFEDIAGGFTSVGRGNPNSFAVIPLMVYKIYLDGHEELVRGVDLIGTPLTVFTRILAASTEQGAFNGTCVAESGAVPVSAAGPALLLGQIEVQKKVKSQELSPILPPPFDDPKPSGK